MNNITNEKLLILEALCHEGVTDNVAEALKKVGVSAEDKLELNNLIDEVWTDITQILKGRGVVVDRKNNKVIINRPYKVQKLGELKEEE